jgi:hypothetical protein
MTLLYTTLFIIVLLLLVGISELESRWRDKQ